MRDKASFHNVQISGPIKAHNLLQKSVLELEKEKDMLKKQLCIFKGKICLGDKK